jgi:L-iditol 2-dehydrogenase
VRVRACGVCGSDVHGYDGSTGRRIPPLVMGHEAAGLVEGVGAGVAGLAPGDRVTFDSTVSCGRCAFCLRGEVNLCDDRRVLGVSCAEYRRHGAFAEYVSVPARIVYPLPESVPFEHAALIEAIAVAVHAVGRKRPSPNDRVVVVGCGMIGLLLIQVLRDTGCAFLIALDPAADRLAAAERLGAHFTLDPYDRYTPATIATLTGGGADLVFEAVGCTEAVHDCLRSVRKGGTVTLIGNLAKSIDLPLQDVVTRQISLLGSCASSGEYPACIDMLARGAVDVASLISTVAPLEEGPALFERLHRRDPLLMKVILQP